MGGPVRLRIWPLGKWRIEDTVNWCFLNIGSICVWWGGAESRVGGRKKGKQSTQRDQRPEESTPVTCQGQAWFMGASPGVLSKASSKPQAGLTLREFLIWAVFSSSCIFPVTYQQFYYYYYLPQEKRKATRNSRKSTQDSQGLNIRETNGIIFSDWWRIRQESLLCLHCTQWEETQS